MVANLIVVVAFSPWRVGFFMHGDAVAHIDSVFGDQRVATDLLYPAAFAFVAALYYTTLKVRAHVALGVCCSGILLYALVSFPPGLSPEHPQRTAHTIIILGGTICTFDPEKEARSGPP